MNKSCRTFFAALLAVLAWAAPSDVAACNVPVFRYALERWPADAYRVTVFHRGEMAGAQKEVAKALADASESSANLAVAVVDVAKELPSYHKKAWDLVKDAALPVVLLQYPVNTQTDHALWSGPLTAENVRSLVDSPARRQLAGRLQKGESAVWLLLESGDAAQDKKVADQLATELKRIEKEVELPPAAPDDPTMSADVPLRIAFSVLRVPHSDPAEQMLVRMLRGLREEAVKEPGPLVVPVFGRGRALDAFAGGQVTGELVENVIAFICGACSCEVKSMNPGVDLLVATDWDAALTGQAVKDPPLPPLISLSALAAAGQTGQVAKAVLPVASAGLLASPLVRNVVLVLLAVVVVIGALTAVLMLKKRNR
ncbi:MAG: hypothetical protein HZC54_24615 [Verrucomicrobia bacterium]|nr:hypothetical protein [Verrucomicrobiota bacterium]